MIGNADGGRPPKISLQGWEFVHYTLSPDNYPAVERYRLPTLDGTRAFVELHHDGNWYVRLYPGLDPDNRDKTMFAPADAFATPTDALAVLVSELHNRRFGGAR